MYWPVGTPRIYAPGGSPSHPVAAAHTRDGFFSSPPTIPTGSGSGSSATADRPRSPSASGRLLELPDPDPWPPATPTSPAVRSVESDDIGLLSSSSFGPVEAPIPHEPVLAVRVSRPGNVFTSLTSTSIVIWQTKPAVVLATVIRSQSSLRLYGHNVDIFLRPDAAIFVVQTSLGFLVTYSLATGGEVRVYKSHFSNYSNVQRRRQSHVTGQEAGLMPDQFLWGPGEGGGVADVSVRFGMVIKVDAGIEAALALDDELIVATRRPAAVQCIRWTPDDHGTQTRTELLHRVAWMEKKAWVTEMAHDRPMNLAAWITNDGRAYAVQRRREKEAAPTDAGGGEAATDDESKRLFEGHCFHVPAGDADRAVKAVINARFSLVAVGCADGSVRVYSARDYSGNIPHSHGQPAPSSAAGSPNVMAYSPDGYCLFVGYENGWAMWSVYGTALSSSFGCNTALAGTSGEGWLCGIRDAAWVGGGSEIILASPDREPLWVLEMARSAVTGCYNAANLFRTVLQTSTSIMVYRGYDLPDLTTISTEPFLWHTSRVPSSYLLNQWPIRCTAISPDGRYVAVAGRRGLAHYSVNSGRWKTFASEETENEFQVRGGMCWYSHLLVAAVDANKSYELRLFSRESALSPSLALHVEKVAAPVVLVASAGEDSLLVYTHENVLYHYVFAPGAGTGTVRLVQVGHIGFHGIVRSPARVRGLTWLVPERQLLDGDPSTDVTVASVLFLVDGRLVLLRPSVNEQGQLKYDMRAVAQNVEFHASMSDQPPSLTGPRHGVAEAEQGLRGSLWTFDGAHLRVWTSVDDMMHALPGEQTKESATPISVPVDFYPLSILLGKGIALGVESELVQRRDMGFSHFRFSIRTQLILPDILRSYLANNKKTDAAKLAQQYQRLAYFPHALEVLLHRVLDEEVDTAPAPEDAVLPRVLSLLSSFKEYLDIVLQCTRKTEVRQWRTLFAYLPQAQELFEESLQRGSLKTAGGYLLVLHTLEELDSASEQSVRLLSRAMKEKDWELCKELARFLAAMDETGDTLRSAMQQASMVHGGRASRGGEGPSTARPEIPVPRMTNGRGKGPGQDSSDGRPAATSDEGSVDSVAGQVEADGKE